MNSEEQKYEKRSNYIFVSRVPEWNQISDDQKIHDFDLTVETFSNLVQTEQVVIQDVVRRVTDPLSSTSCL